MSTRRNFIKASLLTPAAGLGFSHLARAVESFAAETNSAAYPEHFFIYDRTLALPASFHATALSMGLNVLPVASDIGMAWRNILEPRLKHGPVTLTGLLGAPALFCLEYLSMEYGLVPQYRIEHSCDAKAVLQHKAVCAMNAEHREALIQSSGNFTRMGESWSLHTPELAANILLAGQSGDHMESFHPRTSADNTAPDIYSWMLVAKHGVV